jgi:hypothetical protein
MLICGIASMASGQFSFRWGPEIGYAMNQIPSWQRSNGVLTHDTKQTPSPILGIQGNLIVDDTWIIRGGLQYQWLGKRNLYHQESSGFYVTDIRQQNFQKICFPIGIGIYSGSPDFKVSVVLGYRGTLYVYGHVRKEYTYNLPAPSGQGGHFLSFDPFTSTPNEPQMSKPHGQFCGSLSALIATRVNVGANLAIGRRYPYSMNDDLEYEMVFGNSDLFLTVSYLFGK